MDNQKYSEEYIMLNFRLKINQQLYDAHIIPFKIFKKMEEMLIKRIDKLNIFIDGEI